MKKVLFVGQAMPRTKRNPHDWPTLNAWLYSLGITQDEIETNFRYSALVDYFPGAKKGSHLVPSREQIGAERERLGRTIKEFSPEMLVTIGKLSLSYCLAQEVNLLNNYIGKSFEVDPYGLFGNSILVIPFPHPSGASTWYRKPANKKLLNRAFKIFINNL